MKLDLSKLTDAVTSVAGLAADHAAMVQDLKETQAAIDTLTNSLLAATKTPAEAVGIAAVAAALATPSPVPPAAPSAASVSLDQLVADMKATAPK